jgi:hypothetical protein
MKPVVVAHNQMKPLTHAFWPLRILGGCYPNAVVSGFFYCSTSAAPLAILSAYVCGSEGGKRITLTETFRGSIGKRVHEGSAPSDKQAEVGDDIDCRRDRFSGLINKAADCIKGRTPMLTPNWVLYRILISIIPVRCPYYCPKESKQESNHNEKTKENQVLSNVI